MRHGMRNAINFSGICKFCFQRALRALASTVDVHLRWSDVSEGIFAIEERDYSKAGCEADEKQVEQHIRIKGG